MPDSKRSRKYNNKKSNSNVGTKFESRSSKKPPEEPIQPKILLKSRPKEAPATGVSREAIETKKPVQTITIQTKEKETSGVPPNNEQPQPVVPVQQMTRSMVLSNLTHQLPPIFDKSNNDFLVVGIIGTQGVGKSTLMNVLVSDTIDSNVYRKIFHKKDGAFTVKNNFTKTQSWLESTDIYVTKDRMIFIDCPPALTGSYRKDVKAIESDDLKMIIFLFTVCHLVILVQDDYFNLSLVRLLQFSGFTKPNQNPKANMTEYFPNIMFVKNRAKRNDFLKSEKEKTERFIKYIFKSSKTKIFVGQTDKNLIGWTNESDNSHVNYFVFPDAKDDKLASYHQSLEDICNEFRHRVFSTPRNQIQSNGGSFNEAEWFDLAKSTALNKNNFFLTTYEEIRRFQLHAEYE